MAKIYKVGILGSTGYTGATLTGLLAKHPNIEIVFLASQQYAGQKFSSIYSEYRGLVDIECSDIDDEAILNLNKNEIDLVFFATPNGIAHKHVPGLIAKSIHCIDLSADYRFKDLDLYTKWYGFKRTDQAINAQAVYGLVEFNRAQIKAAAKSAAVIIGNPGCYTTSSILALAPILEAMADSIDTRSIIIDGKSGISGAGRKAATNLLFSEINESCSPYKLANQHRHGPELECFFSEISGKKIELSFSPHLVPMSVGLLTTCYINFTKDTSEAQLRKLYETRYSAEQFIKVLEPELYPQTKWAVGTNKAFIQVNYDPRLKRATITCAIDNLMKGAAGQALQNMNLIFGLEEGLGLS
ncbi:MAG: N-acetyl-gamma-glutamyl-phosphate reductase [Cyanobacteria bacterium]|nr:N-acetyl-gamma-glutamyl-phosphate reductase [Cyanobacteriota bacterium]MDA1020974.1 N-acetyl-gamma-glutamyl-phosphate reductase [Cyanobacteriota bacterium]